MFGTKMVGAIHGRLLTAWATAGILGPVLVNYLREYQIAAGLPNAQAYNQTMYILAGLLVLGLICNLLVRPVAARHYMADEKGTPAALRPATQASLAATPTAERTASPVLVGLAWAAVGVPLAVGVLITLQKTAILLH
jgi:hypothetical protein